MNRAYVDRVDSLAMNAALDVVTGDAPDVEAAVADIESPALRADAEFLAEILVQEVTECWAEINRRAAA